MASTLQQLRDGVAEAADVTVAASGVRHTNALVDGRLNRAWRRWYQMVVESGDDSYMLCVRCQTVTSTTRQGGLAPNRLLIVPANVMLLRGLDIYAGQTPIAMFPIDLLERNDSAVLNRIWDSGVSGRPMFYRITGSGIGSMYVLSPGQSMLQIFPGADAVYDIDAWVIPFPGDLPVGGMESTASGDEWVINDAAMQTLRADQLADTPAFAALGALNQKIEADMRYTMACRGTVRKVDTFAMRDSLRRWLP